MFVRVKKIGGYEYLYLVENVREGGRHVQRVIKSLGRRDEVEASGLLDGLIASAARHSRRSIVLSNSIVANCRNSDAPVSDPIWSSAYYGPRPDVATSLPACSLSGAS